MFTVTADYFATGEGTTRMILFTRGYGDTDRKAGALKQFKAVFGDYFAMGAEVHEGMRFDLKGYDMLVSERAQEMLLQLEEAGGLEYHASLHFNLS